MGLLDGLRSALGLRASSDATRPADPDALFELSTGYVTLAGELDFEPAGRTGLCFADVDATDFQAAMDEVEAVLAAQAEDTGAAVDLAADSEGYRWIVVGADDFEDLLTAVHFAASTLIDAGFGSRLLAAVFAFERERDDRRAYWLYSFRRGAFYPFAPALQEPVPDVSDREAADSTPAEGSGETAASPAATAGDRTADPEPAMADCAADDWRAGRRDDRLERKLRGALADELTIESDRTAWYPLWPSRPGRHPWE